MAIIAPGSMTVAVFSCRCVAARVDVLLVITHFVVVGVDVDVDACDRSDIEPQGRLYLVQEKCAPF